jgi:hypothetical protein
MALLHYLSFIAIIAAFAFVTLSLASGLLYVSELIEEHSRDAKIIGQRGIYIIISLHILLYITDSLPFFLTIFSIFCHIIYLQNFSVRWPFISLTSLSFIASCALVVVDHFLWFFYFARINQEARQNMAHGRGRSADVRAVGGASGGKVAEAPGFADIATFFGVCVWLAPLFLFLSLSAGDHALPTAGKKRTPTSSISTPKINFHPSSSSNIIHPRGGTPSSLFKSLCSVLPAIGPLNHKYSNKSEGLIAPRTPTFPFPSMPSSPIRSISNPNQNPLPPPSPRTPGSTSTNLLIPGSPITPHGQDFRLGVPPPRRLAVQEHARMGSTSVSGFVGGVGDNPNGPVRRATADSVGLGIAEVAMEVGAKRNPSRGRDD